MVHVLTTDMQMVADNTDVNRSNPAVLVFILISEDKFSLLYHAVDIFQNCDILMSQMEDTMDLKQIMNWWPDGHFSFAENLIIAILYTSIVFVPPFTFYGIKKYGEQLERWFEQRSVLTQLAMFISAVEILITICRWALQNDTRHVIAVALHGWFVLHCLIYPAMFLAVLFVLGCGHLLTVICSKCAKHAFGHR